MRDSPHPIRTRTRSLLLAFVAVAIASVVALASAQDDDDVVLQVNDRDVTLAEFDERFEIALRGVAAQQGMPLDDEVRAQLEPLAPRFLDQRAQELAWLQAAEDRDLVPSDAAVDEAVAEIRGDADDSAFQELLDSNGIEDEETLRTLVAEGETIGLLREDVASDVELSDDDVRAAYDEDPEAFATSEQVCASHVLVETAEEADTVLAELEDGTDFATVASEWGTDGTASEGGELGCIERGQVVPEFEEAVFDESAPVDEPFGPIETEFGQHVIRIDERVEAEQQDFEDVRDQLAESLRAQQVQNELSRIVEEADVETFPDRLPYAEAPATPDAQ